MGNRKIAIKDWLAQELEAIIAAGQYSGPQSVLPEWFLSKNQFLYIKPGILPLPSIQEIVDALNGLIAEKKLHFGKLQVIEGKITVRLMIP